MKNMLCIRKGRQRIAVPFDDIIFMEKDRRLITIHRKGGEQLTFYGKFDEIMPVLDERFTHPHCSYVINMDSIFRLGNMEALLEESKRVILGKTCFQRLCRDYDEYVLKSVRKKLEAQSR